MLGLRLRNQIAGLLFILFAIVVFTMGYFNFTILSDLLNRIALAQAKTGAERLFDAFDQAYPSDEASLERFIRSREFAKFAQTADLIESVRNFTIYDKSGKIIYSRSRSKEPASDEIKKLKSDEKYPVVETNETLSRYDHDIMRNGVLLGAVSASFRLEKTYKTVRIFLIGNLSLIIIFILTAFIAIYIWSENAINRPIRNLIHAQERLSMGDFDVQADVNFQSTNELGMIASSFNEMAKELKLYREKLLEETEKTKLANEQYIKLNENLEIEVEKKTLEQKEFFSLITHDLKIPLAAIKGYATLLKKQNDPPLNEKGAKFVNAIETATIHLLEMVKNLLDSVKYETGRVEYFMENFDLKQLAGEIEERIRPLVDEKKIGFTVMIPQECRNVRGDYVKIGQVFSNILSNAINYTQAEGEITITAEDSGDSIEIRIRDTGAGIPPDALPHIFEKFQQAPGKEAPSTSIGLGLYIVRQIIEGHGTRVWVESSEGKGSSFYFTLMKGGKQWL